MPNEHEILRFKGHARTVELTAARYGEPLGDEYDRAHQVAREALRIARDNAGHIPVTVPTDPAKVEAHVKKAAAVEAGRGQAEAIALDIAERAELQGVRFALDEAPRVAMLIKASFDKAAADLLEVSGTAPHQMSAHSTADDFAAHTRLLAVVDALNLALASRTALAPVLNENLRETGALWLVLDVAETTLCSDVLAALRDFADRSPTTIEDWLRVTALGLSMAPPERAGERAATFAEALYAAGQRSADGGKFDRTYGDVLDLLEPGRHERLAKEAADAEAAAQAAVA